MLGEALAKLEEGAGVTASGMAAIALVLSRVEPDALVRAPRDCYGDTLRLFNTRAARRQLRLELVDQGGAATLRDVVNPDGSGPRFADRLLVAISGRRVQPSGLSGLCGVGRFGRSGSRAGCR